MTKLKDKIIPEDEIIPCTYDPVFKAVLTDENCREYLADIINYITKIPKQDILDNVIIRNSELMKAKIKEKRKTTDLIVDVLNNRINLEMNQEYYEGIINKNNSYHDKISSEQFISGEEYDESMKIIQINFDMYNNYDDREIIKFQIIDPERGILETKNYEKYHVSLDLINKKYYNKEKLSKEEKELLLLTMIKKEEIKKVVKGDKIMEKVEKKLLDLSEDEELIGAYDIDIYNKKVERTKIKYAEKKALEEGINQSKLAIAKKMLEEKYSIEEISKITNLTIDEIKEIK